MQLRPDWEREGRVFGLGLPQQAQPAAKGERAFDYLVKYPCDFQIKVVGVNEGDFARDIAATVSDTCKARHQHTAYLTHSLRRIMPQRI